MCVAKRQWNLAENSHLNVQIRISLRSAHVEIKILIVSAHSATSFIVNEQLGHHIVPSAGHLLSSVALAGVLNSSSRLRA